ncbi:hypothetical protein [Paenibacillus sp. R14(2021)]|nr:hypothetical protein [Paenibacillus sp. R14(2021)]
MAAGKAPARRSHPPEGCHDRYANKPTYGDPWTPQAAEPLINGRTQY